MIESPGRMIRKEIAESKKMPKLSPEALNLFFLILPHLNSYGKMNGGVGYIKDECCPKFKTFTHEKIAILMREISRRTNVKWFKINGRYWVHSTKWLTDHQDIRKDRLGKDLLPSYSRRSPGVVRTSPGQVPHEVEGKVEEEREVEVKGEGERGRGNNTTPNPMRGGSRANSKGNGGPKLIKGSIKEHLANVLARNS